MSLIYSLKLICDLSFYMSFAGLICSLATGNSLLGTLPYLFSCAFLSSLLANKKVFRLVPLVLVAFALFSIRDNILNYLFFIPACAYTVYYVYSLPADTDKMEYSAVFDLYFKIAVPTALILFIAARENLESISIPCGLIFTACSIILMRMLRHDRDILAQTKFKILNMLSVLGVMVIGALAGSDRFLSLIGGIVKTFYFTVMVPIITFLLTILLYILAPIFSLIGLSDAEAIKFETQDIIIESAYDILGEDAAEPGVSLLIFKVVFFGSLFLLALFLLYKLFKRLTQEYNPRVSSLREERVFLDQGRQKKKEPKVNHQIRLIYRKFMKLCEDSGVPIYPYSTTEDIAQRAASTLGDRDSSFRLRNIYIESRYGEIAPTKENIRQCKEIYNKFKKAEHLNK